MRVKIGPRYCIMLGVSLGWGQYKLFCWCTRGQWLEGIYEWS